MTDRASSATAMVPEFPRSKYDGVRMSLAEFEALPEEKPYLEYWDGVVLQKAVGKQDHGITQLELAVELRLYARRHEARVWTEGRVWFQDRGFLVPDIVYWAPGKLIGSRERNLPPTLAVEIKSVGQGLARARRKCRDMRAEGVDACWLIDPERRWAEVFEGDADGVRLPDDGVLASAFLPGFALPLRQLWAALDA